MHHEPSRTGSIALFGVVLAVVVSCGPVASGPPVARGRPADALHDALIEQCRDASPNVRGAAFRKIEESRELVDRAFPELIKGLADADQLCRLAAVHGLGHTLRFRKESAAALTKYLKELPPEKSDRMTEACHAVPELGGLGTAAEVAIPTLTKIVEEDEDPTLTGHAVKALGMIGRAGVRPLIAAAKSEGFGADQALYALGELHQDAVDCLPDLITLLDADDARIRSAAVRALGNIGRRAHVAVPHLVVHWNDPEIKPAVVKAIGEIGPAAAAAVPQLLEALADPKLFPEAVKALVFVGHLDDDRTREAVRVRIKETARRIAAADEQWAEKDVQRLVDISPFVHDPVDTGLQSLLTTAEPRRRLQIARAVAAVDPENAALLECLRDDLRSKDERIRRDAVGVAGLLGRFAKPLVAELAELVDDPGANTANQAVAALGVLGSEARDAIPQLRAALRSREEDDRIEVLQALAAIDGQAAQQDAERMFDAAVHPNKALLGMVILAGPTASSRQQDAVVETVAWSKKLLDGRDRFLKAWFAIAPLASIEPESREIDLMLEQELTVPGRRHLAAESLIIRGRAGAETKAMVRAILGATRSMACDSENWGPILDSRVWSLRVLEMLGPDAADLVPTLQNLAKHRNGQIAVAARRALEKVRRPGD